jgi:hypothetical protein
MYTIFSVELVNGKSSFCPEQQKMNRTYFAKCMLRILVETCDPEGMKSHERRMMIHSENALTQNTEKTQESVANLRDKRR